MRISRLRHTAAAADPSIAFVQDWPLTGRAEEMRVIAEVLDGDSGGLMIAGGPGVGKTRLSRDAAAAAAERGWTVRSLAGTSAAHGIPLGAFAEWIDHSTAQPLNAVAAVIEAVTASPAGSRVLVVADDVQLLDEQSLFVLHQLARRAAAVVIATVRTGTPAADGVSSLWKDGYLRRLDLEPLARPQYEDLLRAALGSPVCTDTATRTWELTRGNVLFLRELIGQELEAGRLIVANGQWMWTGEFEVSPTLAELVNLTIGAVPEPLLEVLDIVALAEPLELGHLTALVGAEAIEDAEQLRLISVSGTLPSDVVRVGHPLYGEALRSRLGSMRAARMLGRIVDAMNTPGSTAPKADPVRLALLWLDSDLPPDPDVFHQGALTAFLRLDLALTERLARAAAESGAGIQAQLVHAIALTRLARTDEAEEVLKVLVASDSPEVAGVGAVLRATNALFAIGRLQESWEIIDDALETAPETLIPTLQASRVAQLAMAARPAEAADLAEGVNRSMVSPLPAMFMANALAVAFGDMGRIKAAMEVVEQANQLAAAVPQAAHQAVGLNLMHAESLATAGHLPEIRALAAEVRPRWADIPRVPHLVATAIEGLAALAHGEIPAAIERLHAAVTEVDNPGVMPGLDYLLRVPYTQALAQAGRVEEALEAQAAMHRSRHPAFQFFEPAQRCADGWVAAARGHTSQAVTLAGEGADFARTHGQVSREVICLQAAVSFGDHRCDARLAELADIVEGPRARLVARWANALAAGDGERLLAVSSDLEAMGDRVAAANAAAQAALVFDGQNRRGARMNAGERAARIVAACGAVTPATRAAALPLPLSGREREIANLICQGLSNRQIADALTVSVRTVEGHIYRACSKLGLDNRNELGRLVSGKI